MQACKPGFVGYFHNRLIIYLFSVSQPESISLPNHTSLHYQRATDHLREYDLFGLSTRKVCPAHAHRWGAGGLLPHHFTITARSRSSGWLPIFCGTFCYHA